MPGLERMLQQFEQEEFGTNDPEEIKQAGIQAIWDENRKALTGMDAEQAEWEGEDLMGDWIWDRPVTME